MINKIKELKNHQGFMKYFKNTSWLFAEKILRMVVSFFVGIWVARYLGPEQFGLFSYSQSFVGLFSSFISLGLTSIVIREIIKYPEKENKILGSAFFIRFGGALVMLLMLFIVTRILENDFYTSILIFIIASAIIIQSLNVIDFHFQAKSINKYAVYSNSFSLLLSSVIKIFFILYNFPLIAFVWLVLFDSIIVILGYLFWYLKKNNLNFIYSFDKTIALYLLRDSWPLMFSTLIITFYQQLDQVMLKNMISDYAVGQYAAAVRLNAIFSFLPGVILIALTPAIVNAKKISESLFLDRLQKLYDFIVLYSYVSIVVVFIFIKYFVLYTFGNEYSDVASIMYIIILGNVFAYLGAGSSRWFINVGYEKKILYRNILGITFNICGNYFLIPIYSVMGAAVTTILSQFTANLLYDLIDKDTDIVLKQKLKALFLLNYINLILKRKKIL